MSEAEGAGLGVWEWIEAEPRPERDELIFDRVLASARKAAIVSAGGGGDDRIDGTNAADRLIGRGGNDTLSGQRGNDTLIGGGGNDRLLGAGGKDDLKGGGGNDTLVGGGGKDKLNGGAGADDLSGGGGKDDLKGGGGNDALDGGGGRDVLRGGKGSDTLKGGAGPDTFIFAANEFSGGATDTITDFTPGADRVSLLGFSGIDDFTDLAFSSGAGGLTLTLPGGGRIVFANLNDAGRLSGADFGLPAGPLGGSTGGGGATPGGGTTGGGTTGGGTTGGGTTGGGTTGGGGGPTGPQQFLGGPGPDTVQGGAGSDDVRGNGGDDVIGTSAGFDTLRGGTGADTFVIRLENGQIDSQIDRVADFQYGFGDKISLTEALAGIAFADIADVVRATPVAGGPAPFSNGTMIAVNRGAGFQDALFLDNVSFTTQQLQSYGFVLPPSGAAAFVANPYGFTNTSNTSADPTATPDGLYVAWVDKENLDGLTGDFTLPTNGNPQGEDAATMDVFVRNMATGALQRASVGEGGLYMETSTGARAASMSPAISENGRFVAFATNGQGTGADTNSTGDAYLRDLLLDTDPILISVAANGSAAGGVPIGSSFSTSSASVLDISANGRKVAFVTDAALAGNDLNATRDVYVRDLDAGTTTLVSRTYNNVTNTNFNASGGVANPYEFGGYEGDIVKMSADGRYVAYVTNANGLFGDLGGPPSDFDGGFDVYLRDTLLERTLLVSGNGSEDVQGFDMSADGSRIVFATRDALVTGPNGGDRNDRLDIYLAEIDLAQWATQTAQTGLVTLSRVSLALGGNEAVGGDAFSPVISPDGERVAFISNASDMVNADPNFFDPGRTQLYEVNLVTGALREAPQLFAQDSAGATFFSRAAHDLTNDSLVFRDNLGSGDSIAVGATVAPASVDIPSSGTQSLALNVVRGDVIRSEIGLFDSDAFQVFQGSNFSLSVQGLPGAGGGVFNPRVEVRSGSVNGALVASDANSGLNGDAYLNITSSPAGPLFVRVIGESGSTGAYTVRIDNFFPDEGIGTPLILPSGGNQNVGFLTASTSDWFKFDADEPVAFQNFRVTVSKTGGVAALSDVRIIIRDGDGDLVRAGAFGASTLTFTESEVADTVGFIEIDSRSAAGSINYNVELEIEGGLILIPVFDLFG